MPTNCQNCGSSNPDTANFCMKCGRALTVERPAGQADSGVQGRKWMALTLGGSLLLSIILIGVFKLPIFVLFGFLPLLWRPKKPGS